MGLVSPAVATEEASLEELARGAIRFYDDHSADPLPMPSSKDMHKLLDGDVVKIRRREAGQDGGDPHYKVVGYLLVHQPQREVWLAALDPHEWTEDFYTAVRVSDDGHGNSTWYQHVSLPWPLADRHWMIDLHKGLEVARASNGLIWEHAWDLTPDGEARARALVAAGKVPGLTSDSIENAVYLPVNHGGWIVVRLDGHTTLLAYHVTTDVGGHIPESWIATYAMATLDGLLRDVAKIAATIDRHYRGDHQPIADGLGQPIPLSP
jgi:hypothetical protein